MADSAEAWKRAHLLVGGRDVTYFRRHRWWHRFHPQYRRWEPAMFGRPITADALTRILGDPFKED